MKTIPEDVSEQLDCLLGRLSDNYYPSRRRRQKKAPPTLSNTRKPVASDHRRELVPSSKRYSAIPRTPSPGGRKSKMGVRGTDDYLTARAANPRSGLISPSVVTVQTPRTPLTPGEALRLYGEGQLTSATEGFSEGSDSLSSNSRPKSRWRQNSKGWITETVIGSASPKVNAANSSASRIDHSPGEDRFIIPMPSAQEPQPYMCSDQATSQTKAVEYYKNKALQSSQRESPGRLNGRTQSIGAGPRKFAEATKALKTYNATLGDIPANQEVSVNYTNAPIPIEDPFLKRTSLIAFPPNSVDGGETTTKDTPRSFDNTPGSPLSVHRKPLGPRPIGSERRDSGIEMGTASSVKEQVPVSPAPSLDQTDRTRSDSNTSRFQDLRQLPRVRKVHPDSVNPASAPASKEQVPSNGQRVFTLPDTTPTRSTPYPRHSIIFTPSPAPPAKSTPLDSLSPLETQIMGLLAWVVSEVFQKNKISKEQGQKGRLGILQAIHTLSDAEVGPSEKFAAIKALCFAALRAVVIIGCIVAMMRIAAVVGRLLAVIFWPVSLVVVVLKWMVGLG